MATKRKTYPGSIDRHGNGYRWRVCVGGRRHIFTFHTANQKEAERVARSEFAKLSKQADRELQGLPGRVTLSALFDQFEREKLPGLSDGTKRSYGDSLKPLRTYFVDERGNPKVDEIRAGDIEAYMTWRRSHRVGGGTVSNRTIAKDRAVLHAIFQMAEVQEYRDGNPVGRTKGPKYDGRDPVLLSEEEYEKLLEACGDRDILGLYVLALGETGGRCVRARYCGPCGTTWTSRKGSCGSPVDGTDTAPRAERVGGPRCHHGSVRQCGTTSRSTTSRSTTASHHHGSSTTRPHAGTIGPESGSARCTVPLRMQRSGRSSRLNWYSTTSGTVGSRPG